MSGVAGGLAEWSGLPSMLVRVGLTFVLVGTGFGPVIYVIATAVLPVSDRGVDAADRPLVLPPKGRAREQAAVALLVAIGMSILLRAVGIWMGGGLGFPAALAAAGISLAWSRTDRERRELWRARLVRLPGDQARSEGEDSSRRRTAVVRAAAGAVLFVTGAGWVLRSATPSTLVPVLAATVATAGGVALLAGPWIVGLWRDLSDERRARIRTEERAEVAAQLHDSVLQTLALIQRHPDTPPDVALLARHQERSLRSWLFEGNADAADPASSAPDAGTFADHLRVAIHDVEDRFDLPVELVLVGDAPADARADALVAATREAAANAARHSGSAQVAVYAEVSAASLSVFVRDRGKGFDPALVADDRRGLRDSVVGRIERQGGTATIASAPGEGTEVALEVPR